MHGGIGMASASASGLLAPAATAASTAPACPSTLFKSMRSTCRRRRTLSCRASGDRGDDRLLWLPRRDVLLAGITGVAAGLGAYPDLAGAAPQAVLEESCRRGDKVTDQLLQCTDRGLPCPPLPQDVQLVDFEPAKKVTRVRKPVHLLDKEHAEKYKEAVAKMKALPASDPRSFEQQAAIHEAYCDGHYRFDPTEKNRPFDVHFSWIFAPWHRMYIYFYESILGSLIGDDTFALPYWNWDAPAGMELHAIFKDEASPLYDPNRHRAHFNALVDLDYINNRGKPAIPFQKDPNLWTAEYNQAVDRNLSTMYQQMIRSAKGPRCFLGDKLCTETSFRIKEINERSKRRQDSSAKLKRGNTSGSLERMAHSAVHVWTGKAKDDGGSCATGHDRKPHCSNDMGFLGSAGRDPVFYSHHSNVDRMWHLWATKLGGAGFDDPEWLDTSFVFYDFHDPAKEEKKKLVRIKVRDVLDTTSLGYTYDKESDKDLPWMDKKPTPLVPRRGGLPAPAGKKPAAVFPLALRPELKAVEVPAVRLPGKEGKKLQVLVIDGIEFDPTDGAKFDVAVNLPKDLAPEVGPQYSEYAGSFVSVASSSDTGGGGTLEGKLTLVLDDVLADIGAAGDAAVDFVLVPRAGEITINLPLRIQNEDYC